MDIAETARSLIGGDSSRGVLASVMLQQDPNVSQFRPNLERAGALAASTLPSHEVIGWVGESQPMESGSASRVFREIRTLYALGTLGGLTDAQLLELFLTRGGEDAEDAFAALVKRHGSMVLGVCRRMLPGSHDAEDAFQATFLILVRRAASIGRREQLANWLYGVAVRTAKEARRRAARRHARERRLMDVSKVEPAHVEDQAELLPLLDEELNRLPPRYRAALVVCELEGKSRREAAELLGLPEGTLSTHLARGRKLLRERLVKRGVSLGIGAWAGLPGGAVDAAVPDRLLDSTIRAALGPVSGGVASGTVSATVAALAEGVLKMMVLTRLTLLVAGLMVVGMASLTACVVWAAIPAASDEPPKAQAAAKPAAAGARDQAVAARDARQDRVRGVVVDEAGNPVAGIEVKTFKDRQPRAVTDERGRFDFPAPSPLLNRVIVLAGTADRTRQGVYDRDFEHLEVATPQPIRITLKPSQAVFVRVTDKAGVPVPGAAVETLASYATGRTDENGTVVLRFPPTRRSHGSSLSSRAGASTIFSTGSPRSAIRPGSSQGGSISSSTGLEPSEYGRLMAPASPSRGSVLCPKRSERSGNLMGTSSPT